MGRRKRGWNAASGLSLGDLRRLIEAKEAETAELADQREALVAELGELDAKIAAESGGGARRGRKPGKRSPGRQRKAKRGLGRPPNAKRGRPAKAKARRTFGRRSGRKPGAKGQSPLHNMIRTALEASSGPVKLADLAGKVKAAGYKTTSANFALILGLRLSEMKDVKRVERGVYTM